MTLPTATWPPSAGLWAVHAHALGWLALRAGARLVLAESCTAGLLAHRLSAVPGSSQWLEGGVVSYSNPLKIRLLGVQPSSLADHGAVSAVVAEEMARGALGLSDNPVRLSLAITGIAGPDGGSQAKPVGTVWFGLTMAQGDRLWSGQVCRHFSGERQVIQAWAAWEGMCLLAQALALGQLQA